MRSAANKEERRLRKLLETYSPIRRSQFNQPKRNRSPFYGPPGGFKLEEGLWPGRATNVELPRLGKLDQWHKVYFDPSLVGYKTLHYCIRGLTIGHPKFRKRSIWIITGPVVLLDPGLCEIWTKEGIYQLGEEVVPRPKNIWSKFPLPKK